MTTHGPLRLGIGGPVGSGKTALTDALCKHLRERYSIAAITNDIYTREDAQFLERSGALPIERIAGVETGGCPHTAIREDASMNLAAVADMTARFPDLELVIIESGGDNLAATFSPELADITIYVIDVSPLVGADLGVMDRDAKKMRGDKPFVFTNIRAGDGVAEIAAFIERAGGLESNTQPGLETADA